MNMRKVVGLERGTGCTLGGVDMDNWRRIVSKRVQVMH